MWALKYLREYIKDVPITVYTDHSALKLLFQQERVLRRLARWSIVLSAPPLTIEHYRGTQNETPDALSHMYEVTKAINEVSAEIKDVRDKPYY